MYHALVISCGRICLLSFDNSQERDDEADRIEAELFDRSGQLTDIVVRLEGNIKINDGKLQICTIEEILS